MQKYAVIQNKKVVNLCLATDADVKPKNWVLCDVGGIGWDYINGQFADNRPVEVYVEPAPELEPTKEELLAELAALTKKIKALA